MGGHKLSDVAVTGAGSSIGEHVSIKVAAGDGTGAGDILLRNKADGKLTSSGVLIEASGDGLQTSELFVPIAELRLLTVDRPTATVQLGEPLKRDSLSTLPEQ